MRSNRYVDDPGRQCDGKVGYPTKERAKLALRRISGTFGKRRSELRPYRCPHCGQWHFGSRRDGIEPRD